MRCLTVDELPPLLRLFLLERIKGDLTDVLVDYEAATGALRWWRLDGTGAKGTFLLPADLIPDAARAAARASTEPAVGD